MRLSGVSAERSTRARVARLDPGARSRHRRRPRRAARAHARRRPPPPRRAARRRPDRGRARRGPAASVAAAGRRRCSSSPTPGASAFEHAYDDLAGSALRFLAERVGEEAVAEFARSQVSALVERAAAGDERRSPADQRVRRRWPRRCRPTATPPRRARPSRRRRAAVPAPLPGRARRRGVPAAVRGRDRGVRAAARHPRAAARDHRPRRRRLHHSRPATAASRDPQASTERTPREIDT